MNIYEIVGPLKIPHQKHERGRYIEEENLPKFWDDHQAKKIKSKRGCYVFAMKARRGIVPWYVGKTTKSFENECFQSHKLVKYHKAMVKKMGCPVLFFIVYPDKQGARNNKQIKEIENFLIQLAATRNEDLLNIQGNSKKEDWSISGATGGGRGQPSSPAKSFKKMIGIE